MKSCPTCDRTYADDAFTFCLDDGALLSASYDPHATLQLPVNRDTAAPPRTEVLPHAQAVSVNTRPTQFNTTLQAAAPSGYGSGPKLPTAKNGGKLWFMVGGVVAFLTVGLVFALGYMALQLKDKRVPEQPRNSSTVTANSDAARNTNSDAAAAKAKDESLKWLDGVWEGKGYQSNPKTTWSIKLTVQNDTFVIDYPSLSCRGKWSLIEKQPGKARFKEIISEGLSRCENNGTVLIEKIDDVQVSFKYSSPNTTLISSSAILIKRS